MKNGREIMLIAHNLRSCHNVGSLLRTADGLGIDRVILSGYTPYPMTEKDTRLPHEARKIHKQISKTALGAETTTAWSHVTDINDEFSNLKSDGFKIYAVEQTSDSVKLPEFEPPEKIALVVGREVEGIEQEVVQACDGSVEIPMFGKKESFNVAQAAAMTLYHCRFN